MIRCLSLIAAICVGGSALAQTTYEPIQLNTTTDERQRGAELSSGTAGTLQALDKMSGDVVELALSVGNTTTFGRLTVELISCRYPSENSASDAFAFLEIRDARNSEMLFRGWMIASSPALNALDHARYDIWISRCR